MPHYSEGILSAALGEVVGAGISGCNTWGIQMLELLKSTMHTFLEGGIMPGMVEHCSYST